MASNDRARPRRALATKFRDPFSLSLPVPIVKEEEKKVEKERRARLSRITTDGGESIRVTAIELFSLCDFTRFLMSYVPAAFGAAYSSPEKVSAPLFLSSLEQCGSTWHVSAAVAVARQRRQRRRRRPPTATRVHSSSPDPTTPRCEYPFILIVN